MSTEPYDQLHGAAVHEAGHALVARAVGYSVTSVTVDGDGGGLVRHRRPDERHTPTGRWRELQVTLAGGVAELLVAGRESECAGFFDDVLELVADEQRWPGALDERAVAELEVEGVEFESDSLTIARLLVLELEDPHGGGEDPGEFLRDTIEYTLAMLRDEREALDFVSSIEESTSSCGISASACHLDDSFLETPRESSDTRVLDLAAPSWPIRSPFSRIVRRISPALCSARILIPAASF